MHFQNTYQPGFPLSEIIDVIWVAKSDHFEMSASHHAPLFTELIFNYGDQFQVTGENIQTASRDGYQCTISGLKTTPFHTTTSGTYLNVGLIMKSYCFGILQERFEQREMHFLAVHIYEQLAKPSKPRFEKIEPVLIEFFNGWHLDLDIQRFEKHISPELLRKGSFANFSNLMSTTQKTFIQKFKRQYTLTPSAYARLKQVTYAATLIKQYPKVSLTQIGLRAGFYDQPHFIRVFKRHFGASPRQFQKGFQLN